MDEKFHEQAALYSEDQRDEAVADIRRSLSGSGQEDCEDCGDAISPARRQAAPFAIRCTHCQSRFELLGRTTNHPRSFE